MLRRLLLVLLVVVLPIDSVWAAADAHFRVTHPPTTGQSVDAVAAARDAGTSATLVEADCSACHMAAPALASAAPVVATVVAVMHVVALPAAYLDSIHTEPLERPKWSTLAA